METPQSPKIPFYMQRPFGEKLNAAFDFIKENWKVMLKYTTYLLLPICLIQALTMNSAVGFILGTSMGGASELMGDTVASFFMGYGLNMLLSIIGVLLMTSLAYALIKLYNDREERLVGITFKDLRPLLFRNMGRLFLIGLLLVLLIVVVSLIAGIAFVANGYSLLIILPVLFVVSVALSLWPAVYLFEKISFGDSFSKAFRMGFATWGGVLAVLLIMGIISTILRGVLTLPWYAVIAVKSLFVYSADGVDGAMQNASILYKAAAYVLGVILIFGTYLSMIFGIVGLSYQYAHASEKLDGVMVESEIDNFENL